MDLNWGESVASTNEWLGKLDAVIFVPTLNRVTHIIIKRGRIFPKRITLPLENLSHGDREGLYLNASTSELLAPSSSDESEGEHHVIHVIDAYTPVHSKDETPLRLRGVRVVLPEGDVTQLVLKDPDSNDSILLAADEISSFDYTGFTISLATPDLDYLPTYRHDHDIESDIWEVLYSSEEISDTDLKGIEAKVSDGVVILSGNVRDSIASEDIESLCNAIEGVVGVENHLANDRDIELAIAQLICEIAHELANSITVHAQLGVITLGGIVPSNEIHTTLSQKVAAISGVRSLRNDAEVRTPIMVAASDNLMESDIVGSVDDEGVAAHADEGENS